MKPSREITVRRKEFNWVGHWFTLAEKTGECSDIIFGRVSGDDATLFRLSHVTYDGITGLLHLLRERGELRADVLPRLPVRRPPPFRVQLREAMKILLKGPVRARKWKLRNPTWQAGVSSSETVAFSRHTLTSHQTAVAIARAKTLGVSVNSLLFKTLGDAVEPYLEVSKVPSVWIMPVSVHQEISIDTEPENRSSYLDVYIPRGAAATDIEREIRLLDSRFAFWGVWLFLNLGRWLGEWVMKLMVATNPQTQQKTGVFSNLGNWVGSSRSPSDAAAWFFMPPMVAFQPFAASALTWSGRLSLGVRLHPVLSTDKAVSQQILERWTCSLQSDVER
jgi:hypothetical protein